MPERKSWGGARPGAGRKRFPPCKRVTVLIPIPVFAALKHRAEKEGKQAPDLLREILARAAEKE